MQNSLHVLSTERATLWLYDEHKQELWTRVSSSGGASGGGGGGGGPHPPDAQERKAAQDRREVLKLIRLDVDETSIAGTCAVQRATLMVRARRRQCRCRALVVGPLPASSRRPRARSRPALLTPPIPCRAPHWPATLALPHPFLRSPWASSRQVPHAYADRRFNPEVDRRTGMRTESILAAPILDKGGKLVGVLQCINKVKQARAAAVDADRPFDDDDVRVAETLAMHISMFIECLE